MLYLNQFKLINIVNISSQVFKILHFQKLQKDRNLLRGCIFFYIHIIYIFKNMYAKFLILLRIFQNRAFTFESLETIIKFPVCVFIIATTLAFLVSLYIYCTI